MAISSKLTSGPLRSKITFYRKVSPLVSVLTTRNSEQHQKTKAERMATSMFCLSSCP
jgi:hypothetical protein